MASEALSCEAVAARIQSKLSLPDWIVDCLIKEIQEIIGLKFLFVLLYVETGSEEHKLNKLQKYEDHVLKSVFFNELELFGNDRNILKVRKLEMEHLERCIKGLLGKRNRKWRLK